MARKAKDAAKAQAENGEGTPGPGHNGHPPLSEDQQRALHYEHCRKFEAAVAVKKKYDKELKDVSKMIKADGDSVAKVKQTLLSRTPEGEAELRAEIAQTAEVLRWAGVNVGETADMFPEDRTPSDDRAFAEGKRDGLAGEPRKPNYDPSTSQYNKYMDGFTSGQDVLAKGFRPFPPDEDDRDLRPRHKQHADA